MRKGSLIPEALVEWIDFIILAWDIESAGDDEVILPLVDTPLAADPRAASLLESGSKLRQGAKRDRISQIQIRADTLVTLNQHRYFSSRTEHVEISSW